jgi:hypothetical protein
MTLKWFHIVFIALSMLLSIGVGVWGLANNFVALGIASLAGSAALCVYGPYFLKKVRSL